MDFSTSYSLLNRLALFPWFLLIFFPWSKLTVKLVHSYLFPLFFSVVYICLFILSVGSNGGIDFAEFGTLDGLVGLFSSPGAVLLGWVHYLAFDLVVGIWETKDAKKLGINQWIMAPILFLTLMAGPVGFSLYLLIRTYKERNQQEVN